MEQTRLDLDVVRHLIATRDWAALDQLLTDCRTAEIAETFDELSVQERLEALRHLDTERAIDIFDYLDTERQVEILQSFRLQRAARFLEDMSPDERADLVTAMPTPMVIRLLALLPEDDQEDIQELTQYAENTAGGRMTSEFVRIAPEMNARQALKTFREQFREVEMAYYFYVLDPNDHLLGVTSMRQLVALPGDTLVGDIMQTNVYSVPPDRDQEEVADQFSLYDFYALPVIDAKGRMLGIVTFDDVMDVIEQEASEDLDYFAGLTPSGEEGAAGLSLFGQVWQRLPWLLAFLAVGSLSGFLLSGFFTAFDHAGALVFFGVLVSLQPMLTGTAGNAGTQSVTLTIQALSAGERDWGALRGVVAREALLGLIIGATLALVAFARAMVTGRHALFLGSAIAAAVVICVTLSTSLGAILPMLVKRLGFDPAVISSPLITTLMDLMSVVVYYVLALELLPLFN